MSFYQDEFAGRVATKVMQSALAVRDVWMILADIMVYIVIYLVTMGAIIGSFDLWMLGPFALWLGLYLVSMRYFVPRLGRVAQAQADARSLMTGRITDAYTNIATVKLFSHSQREAGYARSAMQEFLATVHVQMRLVTGFEIVNQILSVVLIGSHRRRGAVVVDRSGQVGVGAVAAATAMALRLNGISHWVMWEMASLFEHIGTVQDGIATLSRPHTVLDAPGRQAAGRDARRDPLRAGGFRLRRPGASNVIDGLNLVHIRPGEKIGLVGRSGAARARW